MHRILIVPAILAAALAAQDPPTGILPARVPRAPMVLPLDYTTPQPISKPAMAAAPWTAPPAAPDGHGPTEPHAVDRTQSIDSRAWRDATKVMVDHGAADGTIWAGGTDWKAQFDARGFAVHPFLGSTAPSNYPVRFETERVTVGGMALDLDRATPELTGETLRWRRRGLIETVASSGPSLEQAWRFDTLPNRGALRIDIAWHSTLQAVTEADGVRFGNELGGLRYAHAMAIDALGRRLALRIELGPEQLSITVPAEFIATAALPLVVDPVIATFVINNIVAWEGAPDLAWDETNQQWLVVWARQFSVTDMDLYGVRLDATMNPVEAAFVIDYSVNYWSLPKVANLNAADEYLVVAQVSHDGTASSQSWIGGRMVGAGTGAWLGSQFDIEREGVVGLAGRDYTPDVGSDPGLIPAYFTVVWTHETTATNRDIHMKQIDSNGNLRATLPSVVDGSQGNEWAPSISRSNGNPVSPQRWLITYLRTWSPTDEDVRGALVTWDGQLIPVSGFYNFAIDYNAYSDLWPSPSSPTERDGSGTRTFMIGYTRTPVSGQSSLGWINMAVVDDLGNVRAVADLRPVENITHGLPLFCGEVDSDGCRFALGYGEGDPFSVGFDARVCTLAFDPATYSIVSQDSRASPGQSTMFDEFAPAVCARHSGGAGVSPHYGLAFQFNSRSTPYNYGVSAADYRGHAPLPDPFVRSVRCGTVGISMTGSASLCEQLEFELTDRGPLTGFLIGPPVSIPIGECGRCMLGAVLLTVPNPYRLTVPGELSLVNLVLSIQGFSFARGPCFGTLSLTNIIDLTVR